MINDHHTLLIITKLYIPDDDIARNSLVIKPSSSVHAYVINTFTLGHWKYIVVTCVMVKRGVQMRRCLDWDHI